MATRQVISREDLDAGRVDFSDVEGAGRLPPVHPGERGGRVVMEERLDGSLAIRFGTRYLKYRDVAAGATLGGSAPKPPGYLRPSDATLD